MSTITYRSIERQVQDLQLGDVLDLAGQRFVINHIHLDGMRRRLVGYLDAPVQDQSRTMALSVELALDVNYIIDVIVV